MTPPLPARTVPRPEYLPPIPGTDHASTFTHYQAACEVCGELCWWTAKSPVGLCPCTDEAVTDGEEAA